MNGACDHIQVGDPPPTGGATPAGASCPWCDPPKCPCCGKPIYRWPWAPSPWSPWTNPAPIAPYPWPLPWWGVYPPVLDGGFTVTCSVGKS